MLYSTVIPIPKDKRKSLNNSENYRAITLSSVLGKILDRIIMETQILITSDYQFGYKKNASTTQCTFVIDECINYYVTNDSSVYCVLLDASKAFDRVHFVKLFNKLMKCGICPTICRLLAFMYTNQACSVRWDNVKSNTFSVHNGVKQGGVLSPTLFSIYFDTLLCELSSSGQGCYIGSKFMGAFAYADDLVLLSPNISGLRKMIKVCEKFSIDYDIVFNPSKSKMLLFNAANNFVPLKMRGEIIPISNGEKHLGNYIGQDSAIVRMEKLVQDLYVSTNKLSEKFKFLELDTLYFLFRAYCTSFYGSVILDYDSTLMERLFIAWRKCIRFLLNLPPRTHNALIHHIVDDIPIAEQVFKRFIPFINSCISGNSVCSLAAKLALHGSNSVVCRNINFICEKYDLDKWHLEQSSLDSFTSDRDGPDYAKACTIRDFLFFRSSVPFDSEDYENLSNIINEMCEQ